MWGEHCAMSVKMAATACPDRDLSGELPPGLDLGLAFGSKSKENSRKEAVP